MPVTRRVVCGDNLCTMRELPSGTVQLVYMDPPFNSGRTYESGLARDGSHRTEAFVDAWAWGPAADRSLDDADTALPRATADRVRAFVRLLDGTGTAAYLAMMAPRLAEAHRLLTDDGSLYVHCDPAASHYLKTLLDLVFGPGRFRNEVVWKRTHAHSGSRRFGPVHDVILLFTKTDRWVWNQGYSPYSSEYLAKYFTRQDADGRYQLITCTGPGDRTGTRAHYRWRGALPPPGRHWAWTVEKMRELDAAGLLVHSGTGVPRLKRYTTDGEGVRLQDVWTDIGPLSAHAGERTGFDTQKPVGLLERIVAASSEPGAVVVDPFAGSGTTAVAAERLGRSWITADISLTAAALTLSRVRQEVGLSDPVPVDGFPDRRGVALALRDDEPGAFAAWATAMLGTVLRRRAPGLHVAAGEGRFGTAARRSWVPLSAGLPRRLGLVALPGVADGLVLNTGDEARWVVRALADAGIDSRLVALDDCLTPAARSRGLSPAAT